MPKEELNWQSAETSDEIDRIPSASIVIAYGSGNQYYDYLAPDDIPYATQADVLQSWLDLMDYECDWEIKATEAQEMARREWLDIACAAAEGLVRRSRRRTKRRTRPSFRFRTRSRLLPLLDQRRRRTSRLLDIYLHHRRPRSQRLT